MTQFTYDSCYTELGLSSIVAISEAVARLTAEGQSIIKFQRGDLNFDTPDYVKEAIVRSLAEGRTKYPKSGGEPRFREAAVAYHAEDGIDLQPDNIVCVHGGQEGLQLAFGLFRGQRVLGLSPYWPCLTGNIFPYTRVAFETLPLEMIDGRLTFDPGKLDAAMKKADVFYYNSPHNPTGKLFTPEEIRTIDEIAVRNDVIIVADEPYDKITYDNARHYSMLETGNSNTITVFSGSKSFAGTGLRIGYVVCRNTEITRYLTRANYSQTAGVATPLQDAYAAALTDVDNREKWFATLRGELQQRRDALYDRLRAVFPNLVKPHGAFYFFPDLREILPPNIENIDAFLLDTFMTGGVAIVPGGTFGQQGHIRVSFSATDLEETAQGADRIVGVVKELKARQLPETAS
jgi:aspartate aminotransferase